MKLRLEQIINGYEALKRLNQEKTSGGLSYKLSRNLDHVTPEIKKFEDKRLELVERYGKLSEDKTQYIFVKNNADKFSAEIKDMVDTEIEVNIVIVSEAELDKIQCTGADLLALDWMIQEEKV